MGQKKLERVAQDNHELENSLGHKPELQRNFSFVSLLGLAFAILNSWTSLSVSLSVSLPSGGPSSVIWGLITAGVGNLCMAASMAEFLSAFPAASGQYYWVAVIAPRRLRRFLSWFVGWLSVGGWIAMNATGPLLASQLIQGIITVMHQDYKAERWHTFCIFLAFAIGGFLINIFGNRLLPIMNQAAFMWSLTGFVVISITILACASPDYPSGEWVYSRFKNETNWPNGFAWLLGLLQGAFGLAAYDSVAHMIEEIPHPRKQGPRVMIAAVLIGISTGFVFLTCVLFASGGEKNLQRLVDAVQETALITVFEIATKNRAGAVCLTMFPLICMVFTTTSLFTASSRMSYAFSRDKGLPFYQFISKIHPTLDVPVYALILSFIGVVVFGCIYLGSSSAFNAIVSASVVWLTLSYAIPVFIDVLYGRTRLADRPFRLPNALGWVCNIVGILYVAFTAVLFHFPPFLPVTGNNMNYCVVAFAILEILCLGWWFLWGSRNYRGPPIDGALSALKKSHQHDATDEYLVTKADGEKA